MGVIHLDPFRDLPLRDKLDRLLDEAALGWPAAEPRHSTAWSPAVDIYETDSEITAKAELPGVKRGDIQLSLEQSMLTLSGTRHLEKDAEEENDHWIDRAYGRFSRSFLIPGVADESGITAAYEQGVLTIVLPRTARAKPRQIEINIH